MKIREHLLHRVVLSITMTEVHNNLEEVHLDKSLSD